MAVLSRRLPGSVAPISSGTVSWHLTWFAGVSAVSFLVPFTFSSLLSLQHDVYYLIYFAAALSMLSAYVVASGIDLWGRLRARWQWSVAIGLISTAFVVWSVLAGVDGTRHPTGLYFGFEIAWRGVIYGVVDALLLSAFPGVVALGLMQHDIAGVVRRVIYAGLTLLLVVFITGAYHLGYADLRNKDVLEPELGNSVISLPVLLTANPVGSVIAHTSMHLAAVTHAYESKDRLPPQTFVSSGDPNKGQMSLVNPGVGLPPRAHR